MRFHYAHNVWLDHLRHVGEEADGLGVERCDVEVKDAKAVTQTNCWTLPQRQGSQQLLPPVASAETFG